MTVSSSHFIFSVRAMRRLTRTINFREKEKEILDQIIGSDRYDSRIRPAGMLNDTSKSKNCILSLLFLLQHPEKQYLQFRIHFFRCASQNQNQSLRQKYFANWWCQDGNQMYLEPLACIPRCIECNLKWCILPRNWFLFSNIV